MNLERAEGLVLRHHPLTETSLIVHWLTRQQGRLRTVARGALRPKSALRGKLDVFFQAEFTFVRSAHSDLHTLREVGLQDTHPALRRDFDRLRLAAYAARLIEQNTESDSPVPEIYDLLREWLEAIAGEDLGGALVATFELCFLEALGLGPAPQAHRLGRDTQDWVERLRQRPLNPRVAADCPAPVREELDRFLRGFLVYHLGRLPKGRPQSATLPSGRPPSADFLPPEVRADQKNIEGEPGMTAE